MVSSKGIQRQQSRGMTAPFDGASLETTSGAVEEKREREVLTITEDISTFEDAMSSGVPGVVEGFIGRMTDKDAIQELTAVQGVAHYMETPIMRAARSGSVAMFTAVHQSMLRRMDDAQMVDALVARDEDEADIYADEGDAQHTALHMEDEETCAENHDNKMLLTMVAAEAGSEDIFDEVVKLLDREEPIAGLLGSEKEAIQLLIGAARGGSISIFRRVLKAADQRMKLEHLSGYGRQLLFGAARGGSLEVFESVLKMLGDPACDVVKARSSTGYTTLMAAAGSGSVDVVSSVGERLAAHPDRKEVEDMIRANNKAGYSCLLAAASSGRVEVVTKILEIMKKHLAEDEVQRMTIAPCLIGDTVLMVAAAVPDGSFYSKVVDILDKHISERQMCNMLKATGYNNWNILMEATKHGSRGVIEAVIDVLRKKLEPHEVSHMLLSQYHDGRTVLMLSVISGKAEAVEAVVEAMQVHLEANEVTRNIKARSRYGYNVLILAACLGERGAFLSVKKIVIEKLGDKVVKMIRARCGGNTVLTEAIERGRVSAVEAAGELMAHLSEAQAREMVRWGCDPDNKCPTVFMAAVMVDGSTKVVEAVGALAHKYLKDDEVVELMKAKMSEYTVFRMVTNYAEDPQHVKAVLKIMESLTDDQILELASFGDGRGRTLLVLAVESGIPETLKLIAEFLRSKLDANQMLHLLSKKDEASCTALMLADQRQSEAPEIYQTLVELSEGCKMAAAGQGSEVQDSASDVGVCARPPPFPADSGGETRMVDNAATTSQPRTGDGSDDERDNGDVDKPLPLPQGRVKYPTSRQAEAGPGGNGDGGSSADGSNRHVSTVLEAISNREPTAIENVLENMTREQAIKELCGPANARVTPILRAARESKGMFLAVLEPMKHRLTESQMAAALAGGTDAIGFQTAKKKRFSDVVTAGEEPPYLSSDEFMRALILIAAQGRDKEVFGEALNQSGGSHPSDSQLNQLHQAPRDAENLFLAAARGGSTDIFDHISRALPAKAAILRKSLGGAVGERLLHEAVKGGSVPMLQKVLDMLGDKEIELILANKLSASTILIRAAQSGRVDMVKRAMGLVKTKSIKEMLFHAVNMTAENRHDTVLTAVASSGKADAIKALMKTVERVLLPGQVAAMIQAETSTGGTVLTEAVGSGSAKAIKAVKDAMNKSLKPEQVSSMVQDVDANGNNIFAQAILSGSTEGLRAVADVMDETLQEEEVSAAIRSLGNWPPVRASTGDGLSILALAAGTGIRKMFEAVLDILYENLPISKILRMIEATNRPGGSILQLCVKTGVRGVFEAAVDAIDCLPGEHVRRMIIPDGPSGESVLADAILLGSAEVVEATMEMLEYRLQVNSEEIRGIIQRSDAKGRNILTLAVINQDKQMLGAVAKHLDKHLAPPQVLDMISAIDGDGQTLMAWASRQTSDDFSRTVEYIKGRTEPDQVLRMICENDKDGRTILMAAASSGKRETIKAVTEYVEGQLQDSAKFLKLIAPEDKKASILREAARSGNRGAVEAVRKNLLPKLSGRQVAKELATAFELCAKEVSDKLLESTSTGSREPSVVADRLEDIAIFLEYGATPGKHALKKLVTSFENDPDRLKDCFQRAVSSASNPFIPGMTLSVSLSETALILVEGERRALQALQREVDNLLLEILERLPQTVAGFIAKDDDCTAMLEPETLEDFPKDFVGPLGLALRRREHMKKFCTTPLVLDFMTRKFTLGLPKLQSKVYRPGEQETRSSEEDGKNLLRANGLLPDHPRGIVGRMLHGCGSDKAGHLPTLLPGAQFIIAGVVSNPFRYYDVPLLRMALGFVVYLAMLVVFSSSVLVQDYGGLNAGEYALAVYVVASMMTEICEVWRGYKMYLEDPWNVLDVVALLFLAGGFVTRAMDNGEAWGQYLYALSAPALFSRILFFGLILPAQGPMIQVLLSMTRELVTFGVVMVVVMLGFAMSFFTLFQDLESETYGTAWLEIFKAIFGDVDLFNQVSGQPVDGVATAVLVLYMTVMTIMLLNLLIAVLSTAHANVQRSVQKEFEVSKARMIDHYRQVVKHDFLPAPFNLVQRAVSLPFELSGQREDSACRAVKRSVGIAVFSLVLGPVALAATFLLGVLSVPKVIHRTWKKDAKGRRLLPRVGMVLCFVVCSCLALPAYLAALWLKEAAHAIWRVLCSPCGGAADSAFKPQKSFRTVDENLKRLPGGLSVSKLRVYLENPINDPKVRRDEETRRATVEHIKLLRDRLEDKGDQRLKPLWGELDRLGAGVSDLDGKVEEMNRNLSEKLDGRIDEIHRILASFAEKGKVEPKLD